MKRSVGRARIELRQSLDLALVHDAVVSANLTRWGNVLLPMAARTRTALGIEGGCDLLAAALALHLHLRHDASHLRDCQVALPGVEPGPSGYEPAALTIML